MAKFGRYNGDRKEVTSYCLIVINQLLICNKIGIRIGCPIIPQDFRARVLSL